MCVDRNLGTFSPFSGMGQKIRSHHAALHRSFQSASQHTGGSMQLVRGHAMDSWPPHGIHMPGRGYWKGSRKGLQWRKSPSSSTCVMPKGFHKLCKATRLVPLIHGFVVNMMHWEAMSKNQIVYTHLPCSGTVSSSPNQSTQWSS